MSHIKKTNITRSKQNEFNLKGITYSNETDITNIDNSLNVVGEVTFNSSLKVDGDVSLNSFLDVSNGLNVVGPTTVTTLVASDNITFGSNLAVNGYLIVEGDVSFNKNLIVAGNVIIDGSLNVNESSFTYTKTTINSLNLDVCDNIIKINVKDISSNQSTNLPSGIMIQDSSTNIFFGYSGRKDQQEHSDKFIITKTLYDEEAQLDISLSYDKPIDVFINGSLEISGNLFINGTSSGTYQVVGETNDLISGVYPFAYGAGAYDQDDFFGYPILTGSNLVKVGIMLSDTSMASGDASINEVTFKINDTIVPFYWDDISGYCNKTTKVYPTKDVNISLNEGDMVNIECTTLTLNNFPTRFDVVAVEKARIVMKFIVT